MSDDAAAKAIAHYMIEVMGAKSADAETFSTDMVLFLSQQGLAISVAGTEAKIKEAHRNSGMSYAIAFARDWNAGNEGVMQIGSQDVMEIASRYAAFLAGVAEKQEIAAGATDRVPGT